MIKVYYVKFYQAVQFGKHLETFLGGELAKTKNTEITYEHGLMTVKAPGIKTTHIPFSNIMYFHEEPAKKK